MGDPVGNSSIMDDDSDRELSAVEEYFRRYDDLEARAGKAIREAIDLVIDGRHTGRFSIAELTQPEKTFIGTKVEHLIMDSFGLSCGEKLDAFVCGIDVDLKFTVDKNWMIPQEAIDGLCLLISANDNTSTFNMGLIRASLSTLTKGSNRDRKRSISAQGKKRIRWFVSDGALPVNMLLHLSLPTRWSIYSKPRGQQRVTQLFRVCVGIPISTTVVDAVGSQRDASKRVRDARIKLGAEGIHIYSHRDNKILIQAGHKPLKKGEFMSLRSLTPELIPPV